VADNWDIELVLNAGPFRDLIPDITTGAIKFADADPMP